LTQRIKTIAGELGSVGDDGSFTMYALVFGNVDRQGDVIERGAVQNIDELVKDGWIALNHQENDLPIATITSAVQDEHGLKITGTFHSTPEAQKVRTIVKERLERGKAVKTSIGYRVPPDGERHERQDGRLVRRISKLSVYEASFVNLPANPAAEVVSAKSVSGSVSESEGYMAKQKGAVEALKQILGISTKAEYKVDGEDMERAKGLIEKCNTLRKSISNHHKAMKDAIDEHDAASGELAKCMKNFTSGQQQPKDPKNSGDVAEEDKEEDEYMEDEKDDEEEEEKPKARKAKARKEDDDGDEDEDGETKALQAFRDDLNRRMLRLKLPTGH
jgi:HK97 family phage prohead protease